MLIGSFELGTTSQLNIGNLGAHNLYSSLGFIDHGDRFGKEMAVVLVILNNK
ncbi:hypothetical protein ABID96_001622 [Bacillus sp. OAE603]